LMGRTLCSVSLMVVLGLVTSGWAADDKKDSETKPAPKDYKAEFKDYVVVRNNVLGKLTKVDKEKSLKIEVALTRKMNKEYEFPMLENMEVLWKNLPVELDDKGRPKKISPKDRKKSVTGPGGLKGYPAESSDLKNGQIVQLVLRQKKTKPGAKDKSENKLSVGAVYIVAEPKS